MGKKIGNKVGGMLAILVIICLICNIMSITMMTKMNRDTKEMSGKYIVGVSTIGDLNINIQKEEKIVNYLITSIDSNTYQEFTTELSNVRQTLSEQMTEIATINKAVNDSTINQAYDDFLSGYTNYETLADETISLYVQGKKQSASNGISSMLTEINNMDAGLTVVTDQYKSLAAKLQAEQTKTVETGITVVSVMTVCGIIFAMFTVAITMLSIVNPAKNAKKEIETVIDGINTNHGDLTKRINIRTKDEIAQIAKGVNNLLECLQGILKAIKNESDYLQESIREMEDKVVVSDANINDVSSTTEELAASMEEVTSTIIQLNQSASEILEAAEVMNERAIEGSEMAIGIKKTAQEMNDNAEKSKALTDRTVNDIYAELQSALENSKSVNKINELTGQILDISSQTNLLALNASIEAARAGEAGKGFAVVADEIRVLADNSRVTANNIQEISQMVISAVDQLIRNSESMIEFVSVNVLSDYEDFVKTTNEYRRDADNINSIIHEFSVSSGELKKTMQAMNDGLDGIAGTIDESTQGVTSVANNANGLVEAMSMILAQLDNNKSIADKLKHETQRFISI